MATVSTPWAAMAWFISVSLSRSPLFHAPPWTSTTVGNGPVPTGRYTRASHGASPWRWYSTSLTSTSNSTVVAIPGQSTPGQGEGVPSGEKMLALDLSGAEKVPSGRDSHEFFDQRPSRFL